MYNNILIPVALDENRDVEEQFRVAKALSGSTTQYTVIHVAEQMPRYIEAQIPDDLRSSTLNDIKAELKQTAENMEGASSALLSGHAGRSIVEYATKNDIDCIVVASHVPVVSDILLGSTAAWIVRHSHCPVHVIR